MKYNTYEISIVAETGLKFIEVVAIDLQSAIADVQESFFEVEMFSVGSKNYCNALCVSIES